eukprot:TRINITY_DN20225_c0_g1_i2.p1 TRINITY_DN20225_c0_g1~~TRINITY_DN20225_c0_g1_i2.p1  ORF type:complete len:533 (-),score=83.35 TRINITY_DN20225_c0_g1_i2:175-1773(-)
MKKCRSVDVERLIHVPDPQLCCSICQAVPTNPMQLPCEHIFCECCIHDWLVRTPRCPNCRVATGSEQVQPVSRLLRNLIQGLEVRCKYDSEHTMALELLQPHEDTECPARPLQCPHGGCAAQLLAGAMPEHVQACQLRTLECPGGCGALMTMSEMQEHSCVSFLKEEVSGLQAAQKSTQLLLAQMQQQIQELQRQREDTPSRSRSQSLPRLGHSPTPIPACMRSLRIDVQVCCLCAHENGLLAAGIGRDNGEDGAAIVWDTGTFEQVVRYAQHQGTVWCIHAVAGSELVASGSADKTIRVWDLRSGVTSLVMNGHSDAVRGLCVVQPGQQPRLVSAGDKTVRLWGLEPSEDPVSCQVLTGHAASVRCVCALDENVIASGSEDTLVKLWDLDSSECCRVLAGHTEAVRCMCVCEADGALLTAGKDKSIRVWDWRTGECRNVMRGHTNTVRSLGMLGSGVLGSGGKHVRVWSVNSGDTIRSLHGHTSWVLAVCALPTVDRFATGSRDGTVRIWNGHLTESQEDPLPRVQEDASI